VLRLVLTPDDDLGTTAFAYHSATPAEEASGAPWRRHLSGVLTRRPVVADEPADPMRSRRRPANPGRIRPNC